MGGIIFCIPACSHVRISHTEFTHMSLRVLAHARVGGCVVCVLEWCVRALCLCACVHVCVCTRACVRACVRASVRPCGRAAVRPCGRAPVRPCVRASVRPCVRASVPTCFVGPNGGLSLLLNSQSFDKMDGEQVDSVLKVRQQMVFLLIAGYHHCLANPCHVFVYLCVCAYVCICVCLCVCRVLFLETSWFVV